MAGGGGIGTGRKWPILFAGIMLDHEGMKQIVSKDRADWQEDSQTFFDDEGNATWADRNATRGVTDDFDNSYRRCCTGTVWNGAALSARIMDAKELWGHDASFEYMDWYMDPNSEEKSERQRGWTPFLRDAWDKHRPRPDEAEER